MSTMNTNPPLLTIAMAARNAATYIGEALGSIDAALAGSNASYEVTLADGASSDTTVEIAGSFPHVRVVSRSDKGIYDGMNRAIAAAQGEMLVLLNSDDMFLPGTLARAIDMLASTPAADMVSCDAVSGTHVESAARLTSTAPMSMEGLAFGIPAINARLFRMDALRRAGPIAGDVGLGADREILMRLVANGVRGIKLAEPLYFYRSHAGSATIANDEAARRRIYLSDDTLIRFLRRTNAGGDALQPALRAFDALTGLKLRRAGIARPERPHDQPVGAADLVRGLRLSRKWRGVLSGY